MISTVELALSAARKRVSPQTGFLHGWIEDPVSPRQDTIPIVENFLYAYALFRTRLVENIQAGKILLEKLLAFEVAGNFPFYLHEYPFLRDKQLSAQLLPPLFYLFRDFSGVLGESLDQRLRLLSERIIQHVQAEEEERSLTASHRAFLKAFLQKEDALEQWIPRSAVEWGDYCIASQMLEKGFPAELVQQWNRTLGVFIGGACRERMQEEGEPALTLLDLFMGEYTRSFSKRALTSGHPVHLRAMLVHPCQETMASFPLNSLQKIFSEELNHRQPLLLYWGSLEKVHSLALEVKKGRVFYEEKSGTQMLCTYTFDEAIPSEEESVEIALYLDASPNHQIVVEGKKATVFHPGDRVDISSQGANANRRINVSFSIQADPAQGQWIGHLSKGDRLFQKGKALPYGGYDWKFSIRTLKRAHQARLCIFLETSFPETY